LLIKYKQFIAKTAYCALIDGYYGEVINGPIEQVIVFLASNNKDLLLAMHQAVDQLILNSDNKSPLQLPLPA